MTRNIKGDLFGGLTAGIVALPLALAFGVQSGLGATAGLYGAIFLGIFAAILGGTPAQVSGPTGPMTVVTASTVATLAQQTTEPGSLLGSMIIIFVLAGLVQVIFGLLKLGSLIRFIPYSVISGFMSGIGVIIILLQLFPLLGQPSPDSTINVIRKFPEALLGIRWIALLYSIITILIIYLFSRLIKIFPGSLAGLLIVTIISLILPYEVTRIGDIPSGFPGLQINKIFNLNVDFIKLIVPAAITLGALGSIDSLLTSVVADNITKTHHNSNRELVGQGIGNIVAGLFGGMAGAGATMRTVVNIRAGGRTPISGIIHGITLLIILLGAGKYAALIPMPVLAGILITVGIGIIDYKGLRHLLKIPRYDAAVMLVVFVLTVFLDLLTAVAVGMVLGSLLFMKQMSDAVEKNTHLNTMDALQEPVSIDNTLSEIAGSVYIKDIEGPLFLEWPLHFAESLPGLKVFVMLCLKWIRFLL